MRINTIVGRYIFKELIPPFAVSLAFLTFVFLMAQVLDITNLIVNYSLSIISILKLLLYNMPFFLAFIIPMSVMMAVLLAFLRFSTDNEITALKAGGCSIYHLLPPVALFCFVGFLLTGFMVVYGLPKGRLASKALTRQVALSHLDAGLKEKTFNDSFDGIVLYVSQIDIKRKIFKDIFIEDFRRPDIRSTVIAPAGRLHKHKDRLALQLSLSNGAIHQVDAKEKTAQAIQFDQYDIVLDLKQQMTAVEDGPKDEEEMSVSELKQYLKANDASKDAQYYLTLMAYHKKLSLPSACFALGLLAVPLGIRSKSHRKSYGVGLGFIFFMAYYLLLSIGWVFGETGRYPPAIGMWMPNAAMGGAGLLLLLRTASEGRMRFRR